MPVRKMGVCWSAAALLRVAPHAEEGDQRQANARHEPTESGHVSILDGFGAARRLEFRQAQGYSCMFFTFRSARLNAFTDAPAALARPRGLRHPAVVGRVLPGGLPPLRVRRRSAAGSPGGGRARRVRPHDHSRRAPDGAAQGGRPPRRGVLHHRAAGDGLHPDGAAGRRRRRPRRPRSGSSSIGDNVYVVVPLLGNPSGADGRQRDAPRQRQHPSGTTTSSRSSSTRSTIAATAFSSTINPIGGAARTARSRTSAQYNGDWNPVWDVTVGRFDGGWTVEAAIPFKSLRYRPARGAGLGLQRPPDQPLEERDCRTSRACRRRAAQPGHFRASLAADAGRPRGAAGGRKNLEIKPYVIVERHDRPHGESPACRTTSAPTCGLDAKYGVTQNLTADLTLQHRLRAGRGRRAAGQPDALQPVLSREARVLPREPGHVLVRRRRGRRTVRRHADALLQPAHRPRPGRDVPIEAGGRADRPVGPLQLGAARHPDGGRGRRRSAPATNFSVVRVRRDILRRSSVGVLADRRDRVGQIGGERQPGATASTARSRSSDNLTINTYWAQTGRDRPSGDDTSYRGTARLRRRPLRRAARAAGRSATTSIRRSGSCGATTCARASRCCASARGRSPSRRSASSRYTGSGDLHRERRGPPGNADVDGEFAVEFQNSDRLSRRRTRATTNSSRRPFLIASASRSPSAATSTTTRAIGLQLRAAAAVSGNLLAEYGTFYNGHRTALTRQPGPRQRRRRSCRSNRPTR